MDSLDSLDLSNELPESVLKRLHEILNNQNDCKSSRFLLGLVGAPGAGKSTLATAICRHFSSVSALVPMDGFHLANAELARLGRAGRKGAPDTFDHGGYVSLLHRLRGDPTVTGTVYAPAFHREFEEAVAGEIPVEPHVTLVITEGNYLLLEEPGWCNVPNLLDEVWYVEAESENLRLERLVARHVKFGRSLEAAHDWISFTDEPNARRIESSRTRADRLFRWGSGFVN